MKNSKKMFKLLFGEEMYERLNSIPLRSFSWDGIDVTSCEILATFPDIKERFNAKWIEYFKEHDVTLLDLYLQVLFHYGYQQCYDANENQRKIIDIIARNEVAFRNKNAKNDEENSK